MCIYEECIHGFGVSTGTSREGGKVVAGRVDPWPLPNLRFIATRMDVSVDKGSDVIRFFTTFSRK